ncbi:MAG: protein kinase [Planctomycetes bacterium]|nr:protein kinase [Planctomycetota bacterium]
MPYLRVLSGPDEGKKLPLGEATALCLGRADADYIRLTDQLVSKIHCEVSARKGTFFLSDLASSNGTYLNDRRVSTFQLKNGDKVRIGGSIIEFVDDRTGAVQEELLVLDREVADTLITKTIGDYQVQARIGRGEAGTVYKAYQMSKSRPVALKVFFPDAVADEASVQRFLRGAQTASKLAHPNIVRVYATGRFQDLLYVVMELVDGGSVAQLMEERGISGTIDVRKTLDITKQVLRGLIFAHSKKVVHRNLKPSNILVDRVGTAKLADLWLSKVIDAPDASLITKTGMHLGSMSYIPLEQMVDAKTVDARTDLYSLGATMYTMLTGRPPYSGPPSEILRAARAAEFPDPKKLNMSIPDDVLGVVKKAMQRIMDKRYQSAAEMLADIEKVERLCGF